MCLDCRRFGTACETAIPQTIPGLAPYIREIGIPLAVLRYLTPERLAQLRATAPGLRDTLTRIDPAPIKQAA